MYYLSNTVNTADMVFTYEQDETIKVVIVHNVHNMALDYVEIKSGNQNRSNLVDQIKKELFGYIYENKDLSDAIHSFYFYHSVSVIESDKKEITLRTVWTNPATTKKIEDLIVENALEIEQVIDLYVMAYYGCTNQEVINMMTAIKRDRYVDDLEGFFEKKLYQKELADEIRDNTRYYNEYFEEHGEQHPDLVGDRTKF